ncbi:molybdopterin-binding protein [uncultured Sulfitobacter sp.]|uniref:molybdopterin-binding protein n=1 Tax=uncultured Sulfitobacter sp. TaxID=191468 RepID=UPI002612CEAB|nr:molybdopterin-binding protein [uncultured Sulfitobacter sp.]
MKFGAVPTDDAQGCVLAHSIALPEGRLRKGQVLGPADIAALTRAGIGNVVVARLEQDDIPENDAADALAQGLVAGSTGLRMSHAFTGRVNLIARTAGVAVLDVPALHRVNSVDPMITVATVPAHHQLRAGDMVATIKIISYAVPQAALSCAVAQATGAVSLAGAAHETGTLIITEIKGGAGEKGRTAIEDRLTALGVRLVDVVTVPHDEEALQAAIKAAATPLVLILTGSATSDISDVAPSAVVRAGGRITRFGMPVDPGNLLFLANIDAQIIIGLPGCARAPALNGADWVLSRVVCGIPVTSADIAAMGVGGLLKEIPTRPQPRRPRH